MLCELKEHTDISGSSTANLVRRDPGIPGLGLLLDPPGLLAELGRRVDVNSIGAIRLTYLRYKPGVNCLARYELHANGHRYDAYAKAFGDDAVTKLDKSMERTVCEGVLGPGRTVLAHSQLVFSTFPNDAKLVSLQCVADEDFRRRLFGRLFGHGSAWLDCHFAQSLNYKPERRYVARLEKSDNESVLAKFYSQTGYDKARMISRKLGGDRHGFYPETVGRSKKYKVVAYRWRAGATLRQLGMEGNLNQAALKAAAKSLARFHASSFDGLEPPNATERNRRLEAIAEFTGFLLPQLDSRARRVARQLNEWLDGEKPVLQPVHGDFYDKQVVIDDDGAHLIDMDAARLDNPLLDIGNFLAHLESQVCGQAVSHSNLDFQREVFTCAMEKQGSHAAEPQLNRYIALALFGLTHHPFRDLAEDWPLQIERLLTRVEALLAS